MRAESKTSGLLVAAIIIIPLLPSKPSISVSNWLRVCSLSSLPPPMPAPLCLPTASISSIKIKHGLFSLALLKGLLLYLHRHQQTSQQIQNLIVKKGTPASPAIAFANRVLPVPEDLPIKHL